MEWTRIVIDLLVNLFIFLSLDLFLNSFATCRNKKAQIPIKSFFLILWFCLSLTDSIPYFLFVNLLIDFFYTFLLVEGRIANRISAFVKYEAYYLLGSVAITVIYTLITQDLSIYGTNEIYAGYTSIIGNFLLYIILSMYVILRKLSDFPSGKIYRRYFLSITTGFILMLVTCSMIIDSNVIDQKDTVPLLFSLLLLLTFLCISVYRRVISVLDENARAKIEAEKNRLLLDYQAHVEDNLKRLSTLRHDFKNHLIIIQGYADSGRTDKLRNYIRSLHDELIPTQLIQTPSPLISSILNAKSENCRLKNVKLSFEQHFSKVSLEDFSIVTLLGNLLDNAITAAEKCADGHIDLKIVQAGSYLEIDCTNNHAEQILEKEQTFRTTKTEQKENHGLGIASMRKTVEKLRGKILIDYTDREFHVNILLPNY